MDGTGQPGVEKSGGAETRAHRTAPPPAPLRPPGATRAGRGGAADPFARERALNRNLPLAQVIGSPYPPIPTAPNFSNDRPRRALRKVEAGARGMTGRNMEAYGAAPRSPRRPVAVSPPVSGASLAFRRMEPRHAHILLDTFGSPPVVLAARPDTLRAVAGLCEAGIAAIKTAEALGIRMARARPPEMFHPQLETYESGESRLGTRGPGVRGAGAADEADDADAAGPDAGAGSRVVFAKVLPQNFIQSQPRTLWPS